MTPMLDAESTQCAVFDQTPGSQQKKINIVVRPHFTVGRVISDIKTQYSYKNFELLLQPYGESDLVYLNDLELSLLYEVPGFDSSTKNFLVLLPSGEWSGNLKQRYELPMKTSSTVSSTTKKVFKVKKRVEVEGADGTTVTAAATVKKDTIKDSENSPSVSPSKKVSSDKEKTSPSKKKIISDNGETVKKTLKLKKRVEKENGSTSETSEVTPTTTAKKRNEKDDTVKAPIVKKRIEKSETSSTTTTSITTTPTPTTTTTTTTTKKRIEKDGTLKSPKAKKRTEKEEITKEPTDPVEVNVNGFESVTDAITPTSTIDSTDSCSISNNNNNSINMDIENGLTESTKAAITEQLTQMLPNKRDSVSETFILTPVSDPPLSDDDLALGASASPPETEWFGDAPSQGTYDGIAKRALRMDTNGLPSETVNDLLDHSTIPTTLVSAAEKSYVGLVNQAMTCYLNSLLQALYMTPEFRNALYRWEFDQDNESKNIPYQLQKLFLNLQTSPKSSVETTDLTRSFGWDSTEAWQQHDIQELCRVMFDALEHKSKNTKQAHFISNLYEGKMLDYVKCLECNTEKTREDTFLDIPLPVRPFGSQVAYGSIEEALRAFVQPETLDGNNQYFCDNCNKKCDAHKGLKFKSFPYVLTLHLKRFDFDYQTMHRIKLNDRVTFPQSLNLNSFVNSCEAEALHNLQTTNGTTNGVTSSNVDDCSTADSGSAIEEDNLSSGVVTTASSSQHENDINDEDEGIDMSTSTDHRSSPNKSAAVERLKQESGPYLYELFAIMIHSGSASGGHYYAYIKDFENNEWFCFNDQSVTPITQEDIQKSFGGSSHSAYYSSVYSSSTNAYMLMYRQVDPKRNERAMSNNDFPDHIKTVLPKLHSEEESRSSRLGRHTTVTDLALPDLHKPRVYFYNPLMKKLKLTRIYVSQSFNINYVLESAHEMLEVDKFAPLERCRLVAYDSTSDEILQSLECIVDPALKELRATQNYSLDFLLEYRLEGQEFEIYEKNGTTWQVFMVDLMTMDIDGPFLVHSAACEQSELLRHSIAMRLHIKEDEFLLATLRGLNNRAFVAYDAHPTAEAQDNLQTLVNTQMNNITYFYLHVPEIDARNLEILGIPPYETPTPPAVEISVDVVDAVLMNAATVNSNTSTPATIGDSLENFPQHSCSRESPLPPPITTPGHESNSEDSSLSDGDRTLVESMQHRGGGDSQVSSTSHSPQLSSPEDEAAYIRAQDSYMRVQALYNGYSTDGLDITTSTTTHFFHASELECIDLSGTQSSSLWSDDEFVSRKPTHGYKILVGSRMRMGDFKHHIENQIQVPANYFKLNRKNENSIPNNGTNSLVCLTEGETLTVELGKILNSDEYKAKIYFMRLSNLDNDTGKLPCVCEWVYNTTTTAEMAKRELVAKLHRIDPSYKTLTLENCRLWLKGGRSPIKILDNEESLHNEMRTTISSEFLIQECEPEVKPQTPEDSLTIFVRQWHPDKLQFDRFQEITLDRDGEIREALSKIADIEPENIAYAKINSHFPCTNISVLSVNGSMSWFSIPATVDKYPLSTTLSGHVYFFKDATKAPKELTSEEKIELSAKEKARLDRLFSISTPSSYSPRRERGLKIHLDSPQKPNENDSFTRKVYKF